MCDTATTTTTDCQETKTFILIFPYLHLLTTGTSFTLKGKVEYIWERGLVAVVFNIVLNTLSFILMEILWQNVKSENQPVVHALEQMSNSTLVLRPQFAAFKSHLETDQC